MNSIESELESRYRSLHEKNGAPGWAKDIEPAVPFVGNEYANKPLKCLVFGSAENLTYLSGDKITANNYMRNREVSSGSEYFKKIHMAPISNGALLTASRFILSSLGYDEQFSNDPKVYLEEISVVNFGKYSLSSDTNVDYAGTLKYLKDSFDLVRQDLDVLKPDVIIIPRKIYDFKKVRQDFFIGSNTIVVPIYQVNNRVINSHLKKVELSKTIARFPFVDDWVNKTIHGMDRYLSWLEQDVMVNVTTTNTPNSETQRIVTSCQSLT
ncbi:hypothetical protein H2O73_00705 [Vibrio sp. 404]|uniref:Uncharacterized protein n=1 Tax=Vibrio marinisediminis TaxID=2758441 RepID=A0A7W2FMJ5_9VIBR|nr:hypothetical protein [Vibrio marinisediminis]MBA5760845.1 hypothetical protein [Vibrio marinisediminis]